MNKLSQDIYGSFKKYAHFGFFIPEKRDQYGGDFFVNNRNDMGALDGQRVMARPVLNSKGKKPEAKIVKLLGKETLKQEAQKETTVKGIYVKNGDEFGFVEVQGREKGYFVHDSKRAGAENGDRVVAMLSNYNGRTEAKIINILSDSELIYGEYIAKGDFGFVYTKKGSDDIFIGSSYANGAKSGDVVGVQIVKDTGRKPEGVIKVIKKKGD